MRHSTWGVQRTQLRSYKSVVRVSVPHSALELLGAMVSATLGHHNPTTQPVMRVHQEPPVCLVAIASRPPQARALTVHSTRLHIRVSPAVL